MKGLSFSEPMIKSWMNGAKTVTRRLINPQPPCALSLLPNGNWTYTNCDYEWSPPYRPGETVYIKETWRETWCSGSQNRGYQVRIEYRAKISLNDYGKTANVPEMHYGYNITEKGPPAWKSPRFMPEWASRSHAEIVSVRPERVQEITPGEVKKEGLVVQDFAGIGVMSLLGLTPKTYMEEVAMMEFQSLWESLHPGSWERNDWVWRIELRKEANHA